MSLFQGLTHTNHSWTDEYMHTLVTQHRFLFEDFKASGFEIKLGKKHPKKRIVKSHCNIIYA